MDIASSPKYFSNAYILGENNEENIDLVMKERDLRSSQHLTCQQTIHSPAPKKSLQSQDIKKNDFGEINGTMYREEEKVNNEIGPI